MADTSTTKDWVAVILAVGVATALNIIVVAVLLDALLSNGPGLSENATQILTGAFGGMLGVLGAYLGYRVGAGTHLADSGEAAAKVGRPGGELDDPGDVTGGPPPRRP